MTTGGVCRKKILTLAMVFRGVRHRPSTRASADHTTPTVGHDVTSGGGAGAGGGRFCRRQVLLGLKKRGFGRDKWNGFGGKVEASDQSIAHAAARELEEEACIRVQVQDLKPTGLLTFSFAHSNEMLEVHVFATETFDGIPDESDEMVPQWFDVDEIPFDHMWSDDRFWLPPVVQGKCVNGHFHYAQDEVTILHHTLREFDA